MTDWTLKAQAELLRAVLRHAVAHFEAERPEGIHPNTAGYAAMTLARSGAVEVVARVRSRRPSRRGGTQALYRVKDRRTAERMLQAIGAADAQLRFAFDSPQAGECNARCDLVEAFPNGQEVTR